MSYESDRPHEPPTYEADDVIHVPMWMRSAIFSAVGVLLLQCGIGLWWGSRVSTQLENVIAQQQAAMTKQDSEVGRIVILENGFAVLSNKVEQLQQRQNVNIAKVDETAATVLVIQNRQQMNESKISVSEAKIGGLESKISVNEGRILSIENRKP
jgi:hypothetical protein